MADSGDWTVVSQRIIRTIEKHSDLATKQAGGSKKGSSACFFIMPNCGPRAWWFEQELVNKEKAIELYHSIMVESVLGNPKESSMKGHQETGIGSNASLEVVM